MATAISITAPSTGTNIPGGAGTFTLNATVSCPNTALAIETFTFGSASSQTITSPTGAQVAIIVPPTTNVVGITLKGNSADTGVPISAAQPTGPITFASSAGTSSFVLTTAGAITNIVVIFY